MTKKPGVPGPSFFVLNHMNSDIPSITLLIMIPFGEGEMKIGKFNVKIFKMKNRRGYAALCNDCLTEGATKNEAYDRMVKAIRRVTKKVKNK